METYFGLHIKVKKGQSAQDIACRLYLSPRVTAQQVESILALIASKQLSYEALISKTDEGIAELRRWMEDGDEFISEMCKKHEEWVLKFEELTPIDYEYIEKAYGFTKADLTEGRKAGYSKSPQFNCARELANYVKQYIKGQDEAIEKLSVPFWQHLDSKRKHYTCKIKTPVLLMGPTGVGKSEILRLFASACDCPVIRINTAEIAPSAWKGTHISDIIAREISETVTISDLEYAIIVIHEVDKITHHGVQVVGDRGTDMDADFMRDIMRFFETGHSLNLDGGFDGRQMSNKFYKLPVDNLFIVFDGAFDGIEAIIKRRLNINNTIGFKTQASNTIHKGTHIQSLVSNEDLIEWGFMPELIGRIGNFIVLNSLTTEDIYQIMLTAKESILQSHIDYCAHNHIDLRISDGALHYIASEAYKSGLGFRNVKTLLSKALNRIYYELPNKETESGNHLVEVTKEYVMKNLSSKQLQ